MSQALVTSHARPGGKVAKAHVKLSTEVKEGMDDLQTPAIGHQRLADAGQTQSWTYRAARTTNEIKVDNRKQQNGRLILATLNTRSVEVTNSVWSADDVY
jgi:hypothetical protein